MTSEPLTGYLTKKLLNLFLSVRQEQASREPGTGRYRMTHTLTYHVAAVACLLIFVAFLGLGIALKDEPRSWAVYSGIFGLATLLALYWNVEVFLVRLSFSEEGIHREGGLGSAVTLPWSSINRVDFSEQSGSFCFRGVDGQKIKVSVYLNGLGTFAEFASGRVTDGLAAGAVSLLRQKALNPS